MILNKFYDREMVNNIYNFRGEQSGEYDHFIKKRESHFHFSFKNNHIYIQFPNESIIDCNLGMKINCNNLKDRTKAINDLIQMFQSMLIYKGHETQFCPKCKHSLFIYRLGKPICEDCECPTESKITEFAKGITLIFDKVCIDSYNIHFQKIIDWGNEYKVKMIVP